MEDQFLSLLAYVAEQERKKIRQRQAEGIAAAKASGKHLGRPQISLKNLSREQQAILKVNYVKWKNKELKGVVFMEQLGLKKNTFYKIMKEYDETKQIEIS